VQNCNFKFNNYFWKPQKLKDMKKSNSFRNLIIRWFEHLESVFMLTFAAGMLMLTRQIEYSQIALWTGATGLVILYLFKSFESPKENIFEFMVFKFGWLGLVLAIFGMISKLMMLEKANLLLWIAIFMILFGIGGSLQLKLIDKKIVSKRDITRFVIVCVLSVLFAIV